MNLKESIKNIEKCDYKCIAGDLQNNTDYMNLRNKIFKIHEIIWSLRHGNFDGYQNAMKEIDELFSYEDYDCTNTNQDELYNKEMLTMNLNEIPTSELYQELILREGIENYELYNNNENDTWIVNKNKAHGKLGEIGIHCSEIIATYNNDVSIIVVPNKIK